MIKIIFSHKCKACFLGRTFQAKAIKKPKTIGRRTVFKISTPNVNGTNGIPDNTIIPAIIKSVL